jgi:hypothetical protein
MAAKTYPVGCECGATIHVPGTSAGATFACKCGRKLEVPTLAQLKASVGQEAVSAEFELEQLLVTGALPLEKDCVLCGVRTDNRATYTVTCELADASQGEIPAWQWVVVFALFLCAGIGIVLLVLLLMFGRQKAPGPHGRDVVFRLPVRVCEGCVKTLTTPAAVRDAMDQTEVYARLFDKYPDARIGNAD